MSRCYKPNPWSDGLQLHSSPASCELCKKSINIEIFKSWSTGARQGCSKLAVHIFCYSLSKWTIAKSRTRKGLANSLSPQFQIKFISQWNTKSKVRRRVSGLHRWLVALWPLWMIQIVSKLICAFRFNCISYLFLFFWAWSTIKHLNLPSFLTSEPDPRSNKQTKQANNYPT
jgi:hypothetical protein